MLDTDYAGTLRDFFKSIKNANVKLTDITYVLATHYHPDHIGLVSELMSLGVKLVLIDIQTDYVHFSDAIFNKDNIHYDAIDQTTADVITFEESRRFLSSLGINGEIISIPSHSKDSIALMTDDGNCFVGDLEPYEHIDGYDENDALKKDWETIMSHNPKTIFYAHRPKKDFI